MSAFEGFLGLEKPADADETWGNANRLNSDAIGYAVSGQRVMEVDPHWTTGNLYPGAGTPGAARRKFDTIDAAITAAEGLGWDDYDIIVARGTYSENLTITKSVRIASRGSGTGGFYPGGVRINGKTTTADSVVTITPAISTFVYVEFDGITFENAYNQNNAVEITEPYLIDAQDQAAYSGTRNKLILKNCYLRMQTWGIDNKWTYGVKATGNWHVIVDGCQVQALGYSGATNIGMIRRLFHIHGNNSSAITAIGTFKRSDIDQGSYDDGGERIIWHFDNRAQLWVYGCTTPANRVDTYTKGGTGTQFSGGVEDDTTATTYHNAYAISGTVVL